MHYRNARRLSASISVPPGYVLKNMMLGQRWLNGDERFYAAINVDTLLIHGNEDRLIALNDTQLMYEVLHTRVVNIAIQVSLSLVSAILLEYRRKYRRYFLHEVSHAVSPILFSQIFRYWAAILINNGFSMLLRLRLNSVRMSSVKAPLSEPTTLLLRLYSDWCLADYCR